MSASGGRRPQAVSERCSGCAGRHITIFLHCRLGSCSGYRCDVTARAWVPLRAAWHSALYGPSGFYRRESPADHFRTSPQASPLFAGAVVELARRRRLSRVVDLGAGSGRLLADIAAAAPRLELTGVDLRPRPAELPPSIRWCAELPEVDSGLLLANEVLDNIACDVVQLDARDTCRVVEVDPATAQERLGAPASPDVLAWLARWWPLEHAGQRAEVGLARDLWWAGACARLGGGTCVAIDFGHLAGSRPDGGTLASYRGGRQTAVAFDGDHDVTASVAFDSLAAAVGGEVGRQRDVLRDLGVSGERPALSRADRDPAGYLLALADAGEAAELTAADGLGSHLWLISARP